MLRKRFTPEQIITKFCEAEVLLSKGQKIGEVCRQLDVCENTYYRWCKEYGGLDVQQAKRLKELEKENARMKKLVADLSLDIVILKVERWRKEYNQVRPYSSLGYRQPAPEAIEPSIMDRAV